MASNPNAEKGVPNAVVFMKGPGIDILATLSAAFASNRQLKEMAKHALFMSSIIPDSLLGKKEE